MKLKYLFGVPVAILALVWLAYLSTGHNTPEGQPPLERLNRQNITEIREQFNSAQDRVRLLLLLSPT